MLCWNRGAIMNNGIGITGVLQSTILDDKCLDNNNIGSDDCIANAITSAANYPAKIISMSFGGGLKTQVSIQHVNMLIPKDVYSSHQQVILEGLFYTQQPILLMYML